MLTWLVRSIVAIALLNLVTLVALQVAYGWHHWLKPMLDGPRARRREFERLLRQSSLDR